MHKHILMHTNTYICTYTYTSSCTYSTQPVPHTGLDCTHELQNARTTRTEEKNKVWFVRVRSTKPTNTKLAHVFGHVSVSVFRTRICGGAWASESWSLPRKAANIGRLVHVGPQLLRRRGSNLKCRHKKAKKNIAEYMSKKNLLLGVGRHNFK